MRRELACFALAGLLAGCDRPAAAPADVKATAAPSGPVAVKVVQPQRKALRRVVGQPGTVLAYEETQLVAKLPGFVRKVRADIGRSVRGPKFDDAGREVEPGEVLAEIAIPETEEELVLKQAVVRQTEAEAEQARKALAAAEANVASVQATVAEARAGLTRAQALFDRWDSEVRRATGLVRDRVMDEQSRDETTNQFRAAGAAREEAKARIASAEAAVRKAQADRDKSAADVEAARAKTDVAKADARRLEALLGYTKIRAPFDGVVTRRRVNTGDFLQPGTAKAEGIFTVAKLDPVRVVVEVPEADAGLVRDLAEAKVAVPALGGPELTGTVARTSWSLEPHSRTLRAEIDFPNAGGRLRPGMYVYARITTVLPEAWVLPSAALVKQGDATVCYLVQGGKAKRLVVRTGRTDGEFTEVIQKQAAASAWDDFTGTESVAATNAAVLTDGLGVKVTPK